MMKRISIFWKIQTSVVIFMPLLLMLDCGHYGIDRETLVKRHIPEVNRVDALSPFTVGNGGALPHSV